MKPQFTLIGLIIVLLTTIILHTNSAFAHNFKSDESAEFLTFATTSTL
jgi:hypothetical protein